MENILLKLIQAADYDVNRAEYGIIYIDEIDKITKRQKMFPLPATCPAKAYSRRFLKSWREPLPAFRLREVESILIRADPDRHHQYPLYLRRRL